MSLAQAKKIAKTLKTEGVWQNPVPKDVKIGDAFVMSMDGFTEIYIATAARGFGDEGCVDRRICTDVYSADGDLLEINVWCWASDLLPDPSEE